MSSCERGHHEPCSVVAEASSVGDLGFEVLTMIASGAPDLVSRVLAVAQILM